MEQNFKYEIGKEFYLNSKNDIFHKAKITKRERVDYQNSPSINFYYIEIEGRQNDWYTENFITACAFTEEEMIKRLNGRK